MALHHSHHRDKAGVGYLSEFLSHAQIIEQRTYTSIWDGAPKYLLLFQYSDPKQSAARELLTNTHLLLASETSHPHLSHLTLLHKQSQIEKIPGVDLEISHFSPQSPTVVTHSNASRQTSHIGMEEQGAYIWWVKEANLQIHLDFADILGSSLTAGYSKD
ncbi:hypothetical protein Tco_0829282 [Tanacetum coccineum]